MNQAKLFSTLLVAAGLTTALTALPVQTFGIDQAPKPDAPAKEHPAVAKVYYVVGVEGVTDAKTSGEAKTALGHEINVDAVVYDPNENVFYVTPKKGKEVTEEALNKELAKISIEAKDQKGTPAKVSKFEKKEGDIPKIAKGDKKKDGKGDPKKKDKKA